MITIKLNLDPDQHPLLMEDLAPYTYWSHWAAKYNATVATVYNDTLAEWERLMYFDSDEDAVVFRLRFGF